MGRLSAGKSPVGYWLSEAGVEVIPSRHRQFGRERASREIVRHPRVESAPVAVDLRLAVRRVCRTEARRPVILQREVGKSISVQRLLLVAQTGIDGQLVAHLPCVLHEERL